MDVDRFPLSPAAGRHKKTAKSTRIGPIEDSRPKPEARTHQAGAIPIQRRKELSRFVRQIYNRYSLRKQTAKLSKSGQARVFGRFIAEQQKCKQREILGRNCASNLDDGGLHDLAYSISWL
jgi:hypothetical protein